MARLPQASDLQRRTVPANSPDVRVGALDYSPMSKAGNAVGEGIQSLGRAGGQWATSIEARQTEVDDFATKKALLDFTDRAEQELETYKRQMPVGGDGYSAGWQQRYHELARQFVGEGDANVPKPQREKIGLLLKQYERQFHERAWRDENAEKDRYTIAGLEETVGRVRSRVEADPLRHDEVQGELQSLIDLAPITPAQRDAYKKKVREGVSEAAAYAYATRATTKAGLEEARKILAPHAPDKGETTRQAVRGAIGDYREQIKKFEGFTPKASWDYKQHSVGYGTRAKFPGEVIDKAEAEARLDEELNRAGKIVDTFKPGLDAGTRAALVSLTFNAGDDWTRGGLGKAIQAGDLPTAKARFLEYNKAGGQTLPGLASRRQAEAQWIGKGGQTTANEPIQDASYMDAGMETYSGPIGLPLAKRRAAYAQAEQTFRKGVTDVQGSIKEQMKASEKGVLPPDEWVRVVAPRVEALGDPETSALFATMIGKADRTAQIRAQPPMVQTMVAERSRAALDGSGTAEQVALVEHTEKLAAESKRQYEENPIGWANRNRPVVPIRDDADPEAVRLIAQGQGDEALLRFPAHVARAEIPGVNFGAPDLGKQLDDRMQWARHVARYGGGEPKPFSPTDVTFLENALKAGGKPLLAVMGEIAGAAERANMDAVTMLQQVAPRDAPELAMIGTLVGSRADPRTLTIAAEAIKWKVGQGERFESTINKTQAQPSLGDYDKLFATAPTARDSLKSLANLVYEYEARQKGVSTQFDQTLYTDIVHRMMGQTTDPTGVTYGGVGWQGAGVFSWSAWTDGRSSSQILVPPSVRQDRFDELVGTLRADDLARIGGVPVDQTGTPYSMAEIRNMNWMSVGPPGAPPIAGVYMLKVKDDASGRPVPAFKGAAAPGSVRAANDDREPVILDLRPIMAELQKRKPSIFQGYRMGLDQDQTIPDPKYPTGFDPIAPARPTATTIEPRTGRDRRNTMPTGALK